MESQQVIARLRKFRDVRAWGQFHSVANLAKSVSIEAGELLECFQWNDGEFDGEAVRLELADVLTYCYFLADALEERPEDLVLEKLRITEKKYPIEKSYGKSDKYDKI